MYFRHQIIMLGLLTVFLFTQQLAGQQSTQKPVWVMKTQMVIVDNCPVACPCLVGAEPHHGHCRYVGAGHIVNGHYKGVSLDGVNWAMVGEFSEKTTNPKFHFSAYYIDSRATQEQKKAMHEILSGAPFSTLGQQLGIKETAIELKKPTKNNQSYILKLADIGEFTVAVVHGNDNTTPLKVINPVYPFPVKEITLGDATGKFSDHNKDLNLENNSGEISEFTILSAP